MVAQPMQQPAYGGQPMQQPMYGAQPQPMYGQPMQAGAPMIPQPMMMPFIMALLGSIFLMIGGGLIIGNVFGILCLIFVILAVAMKNRMFAMLTWIFGLIGMIIAIIAMAWNAWAWSVFSSINQYCTYLGYDICGPARAALLIGLVLNILGIVGGILCLLGGRKLMRHMPAPAAPMQPAYGPPAMQPMQAQPMQQQPMPAQPVMAPAVAAPAMTGFCKSCGSPVVSGAAFCPKCGARY